MRGAGTAAESAAGFGQQALSVISSALLWGYQGLKNLLTKTAEYIEPKFVLLTSKKEPNQQQLELIDKLQRDKDLAVLGIHELNELKEVDPDGRCRVVVPADAEFLNYLRNEKYTVRDREWVDEADPTKSIVMPSQSFTVMLNTLNQQQPEAPLQKKEVVNYGGFCMFDLEDKNAVEYEFLQKLRLSKDHLEGVLVNVKKDSSSESRDSKPDYEGLLVEEDIKLPNPADVLSKEEQLLLQQRPAVTVKEVPLAPQQEESEKSRELQLA